MKTKPAMKSVTTIPNAPHLVGVHQARCLYCEHSGNATAARSTVSRWLVRRRIAYHGANEKQRVFDRSQIIAALKTDFPQDVKLVSVEDAFLMAGKPYPNARKAHVA